MIRTAIDWLIPRLGWGYVVLSLANLVLFVWVEIDFARSFPHYTQTEGWPTISRALAHADKDIITALALLAAPGLLLGGLGSGIIHAALWRAGALQGWRAAGSLANTVVASLLSLAYFFMVTITLSDDNRLHMLFSYLFFFGMTFVILFDGFVTVPARLRHVDRHPGEPAANLRLMRWQVRSGRVVLGCGVAFLVLYILKDVQQFQQATRDGFQKAFAVSELVWIFFAHAHAITHTWLHRCHYAPAARAASPIIDPMLLTKGVR